jgi:hypothetical protein
MFVSCVVFDDFSLVFYLVYPCFDRMFLFSLFRNQNIFKKFEQFSDLNMFRKIEQFSKQNVLPKLPQHLNNFHIQTSSNRFFKI